MHTFLLTASLYGRFAAMLARVPIVIGTEVNIYERKQPLHRLAERWLMRRTDAVVASAGVGARLLHRAGRTPTPTRSR